MLTKLRLRFTPLRMTRGDISSRSLSNYLIRKREEQAPPLHLSRPQAYRSPKANIEFAKQTYRARETGISSSQREHIPLPLRVVEGADPYKNRYSNLCRALLRHSQCQPKLNPPKVVKIRAISRKLTRKVRTLLRSFSKNIIKFSPI